MTETVTQSDVSLPDMLAARARSATIRRLWLDALLGTAAAVAATLIHRKGWFVFAAAGACFATFGAWGLVDRVIARRRALSASRADAGSDEYMPDFSRRPPVDWILVLLRAISALIAVAGSIALLILIFGALSLTLGTIIS